MGIAHLRGTLLRCVPDHHLKPLKVEKSLKTLTIEQMVTGLQLQLGTITAVDITFMKEQLSTSYVHPESIDVFMATKLELLADLTAAGQPLAALDAINAIKDCFAHSTFLPCWTTFASTHGALAVQTVAALAAAITHYVKNVLPLSVGRHGVAAAATVDEMSPEDMDRILSALEARVRRSGAENSLRETAQPPANSGDWASQPLHLRLYCHTHWPCNHLGKECSSGKPGHKKEATWANKMGGPSVFTPYHKRR